MFLAFVAVIAGLVLLAWSAERFIDGSVTTARHFGFPPLLVGVVIVGFGTSAPEMVVSGLAAYQGKSGIALGNAYGSNITNIALILGLTALISPVLVRRRILFRELPVLAAVTALAAWQLRDGVVSRSDAVVLVLTLVALVGWTLWRDRNDAGQALETAVQTSPQQPAQPVRRALFWLVSGLMLLILSSRVLVWGAVEIAQGFGVSDLIIGLTIVAVGTSLPELASSIMAARKGEHDIVLGNILGSNLFNTLFVVGIGGLIRPLIVEPALLSRDVPVMAMLTVSLFVLGFSFGGSDGRINRGGGVLLLAAYAAYTGWLIRSALGG